MARLIMFHLPMVTGYTGWMFSVFTVASFKPWPKSVLFCNGRLMRLAIGFCDCLASAWSSWADCAADG
jgi:hypothetical protein